MMIHRLTVLYDERCRFCRTARRWLEHQGQLVPLDFVPAGSPLAHRLFPELDHDATLADVTVVDDNGGVYAGDEAWLMCLWALSGFRALSLRLAQPSLRPMARRAVAAAAALRDGTRDEGYGLPRDDACDL